MKILYHHRIRSKDGQYVHLEELTRALMQLGHEIVFVGPRAIRKEEFGAGAGWIASLKKLLPRFIYETLEFCYSFPAFVRLWWAVRTHRPHGIYERYNLFFPPGIWVHKLSGIPLLLEVNAPLLEERSRYGGLQLKRLARWSQEFVWRGASFALPVTHVLAGRLLAAGVPESQIIVIPNGVDLEKFQLQPERQEAKQRLGLGGLLVLGFTGFVRDWHALDRVVDWIADQQDQTPLALLITGDGPARTSIEELARKRGVAHAVRFTGIVPRNDVMRYVAAYDIALQPAVVEYASPLKIFEYLMLGCAIVAPSMPNIREVLVDGENAILFDPSDGQGLGQALQRLCGDDDLRRRISEGARRTITDRKFTWHHNAERVISLFDQLRGPVCGGPPHSTTRQRSHK
jgi:glycosyltransferase involved in cell wall biosynthesis